MRILIENGLVLAGAELTPMPGAAVAVEDGAILAVGKAPAAWLPEERVDAAGKVVMPGLINAHTHAAMTMLRSYADDLPLQAWLAEKIWPAESGLTKDHVYWGTLLAACEMLRSGTTAFADMYFMIEEIARAVTESGMRAVLSYGMIGLDPAKRDKELATGLDVVRKYRGAAEGRITAMLAPHATYTCPDDFLDQVIAAAAAEEASLHIHISETETENKEMLAKTGQTPTAHMEAIGLFRRPVLLAHGVWLSADDIAILARHRVGVAHCPGSNLKLASGIAPVEALLAAGVPVGLGTDGAASNNRLDLFRELYLAAIVHKVREMDATAVPALTALRLATAGGAACLGLQDAVGVLAPGRRADLILVDLGEARLLPRHDPHSLLAYAAGGQDVTDVMVDGRILLRKREFVGLDEERIKAEAGRLGLELVKGK